jgi:hypothetical protein
VAAERVGTRAARRGPGSFSSLHPPRAVKTTRWMRRWRQPGSSGGDGRRSVVTTGDVGSCPYRMRKLINDIKNGGHHALGVVDSY